MKIHPLNRGKGDNRYCGPAAISFISGINTTDAAALIREVNPNIERVKGSWPSDVLRVLGKLGYSARCRLIFGDKPTLKQWLRLTKADRTAGRVFLVDAGNHYQIISGRKYACGRIGDIVGLSDKRISNPARVAAAWEIEANHDHKVKTKNTIKRLEAKKSVQKSQANTVASARRQAQKIAREIDMTIEVDTFVGGSKSIYFITPDWMDNARDQGELEFTTVAYDWDEAVSLARDLEDAYRDGQKRLLDCEP